jgi:eukaryotic-like serine/threonine-protein kinase
MNAIVWSEVDRLYHAAIERPADERDAFLIAACAGNDDLRHEVESLLAKSGDFIEEPAARDVLTPEAFGAVEREGRPGDVPLDAAATAGETRAPRSPALGARAIGPYRLLQCIGEGGMAEVWLAEQTTPLHRRVAVKVIKAGMDSKAMIARFESERQALALMEHPAIAKVFDAGATPEGQPYFVMEYVPGPPITEYCDRNRLSIRDRLELFMQVCDGVQHAHQKAIIHRDLKPSNVLIALQDGKAVPKIIDFGVAKATAQKLTDKTMFTELGVFVGTLEYMSPEQTDMTGNIDTRTDVYSLGLILYELLAGALPFEPKALRRAGIEEMLRSIRNDDPPRPSTRASTPGEAFESAGRNRKTDAHTLHRQLEGDLDWIVLKALEKDRSRRYGSPAELAAEIGRHLRHEPVLASPPSVIYRARKFARRHRFGVSVAAGLLALLLAFAVTMTVQAQRIARERDRANREAEVSRRVKEFMTGLFQISDPSEARGSTITAREILDRGAKQIGTELRGQPRTESELMDTMGRVYSSLGLYSQAAGLLEPAVLTRRRVLGPDHADTLGSMDALAFAYWRQQRFEEAEKLYREELQRLRQTVGPDRPESIEALNNLGRMMAARWQGNGNPRGSDAIPILNEALERARRTLGPDHRVTVHSTVYLAMAYSNGGRHKEAETLFREGLAADRRMLGPDHPETARDLGNLAVALAYSLQYAEAEKTYREALELDTRLLGPDHFTTLTVLHGLGVANLNQHHLEEAERDLREALSRERRVLGENHALTALTMAALGNVAALRGKREEALAAIEQAIDHGYNRYDEMASDLDFKSLHDDPRFKALLEKLRLRLAAAKSNQ